VKQQISLVDGEIVAWVGSSIDGNNTDLENDSYRSIGG
jgi:hypothetical protein